MPGSRVAVVTGANKGIGYEIAKGLCERFNGKVYLTCRNKCKGMEAIHKLQALNHHPHFFQVDVNDSSSIVKLRNHLQSEYGGFDILVNNAGVYYPETSSLSPLERARKMIETNYFGLLRVCKCLFPILRHSSRIVNLTSNSGHLSSIPSPEIRAEFAEEGLNVEKISSLMKQYLKSLQGSDNLQSGWGSNSYGISKIGVSAVTICQQKYFDKMESKKGSVVNCVYPGRCRTELSNYSGDFLPRRGAEAPLFLCLLPAGEDVYCGSYVWHDKSIYDWYGDHPDKVRCCPPEPYPWCETKAY